MQKIPTLFIRDKANPKYVTQEIDPECQWVIDGEGVPTEKYDGTCCAVIDGNLYKRHKHDAKKGEPPNGWIHWSLNPEQMSGHGWLPCLPGDSSSRYHLEAWENPYGAESDKYEDGTYELVGPKIQGNPYRLHEHELWKHGQPGCVFECERTFDGIRKHIEQMDDWGLTHTCGYLEGIVWWHPDGRMAKIKRRDFGLPWPVKQTP